MSALEPLSFEVLVDDAVALSVSRLADGTPVIVLAPRGQSEVFAFDLDVAAQVGRAMARIAELTAYGDRLQRGGVQGDGGVTDSGAPDERHGDAGAEEQHADRPSPPVSGHEASRNATRDRWSRF